MGRGRPTARNGAGRQTAKQAGPTAGAANFDDWVASLDGASPEMESIETLLRLFKLDQPCTRALGLHKGRECATSNLCLAGIFSKSQADINALVQSSVGNAPATATLRVDAMVPAGLKNLANTCYLNAVLQSLVRVVTPLSAAVVGSVNERLDQYGVDDVFARLLTTRLVAVDPTAMITHLGIDKAVQQDAQEFLALFLSLLSDASETLKRVVLEKCTGAMLYTRKCGACGAPTLKTDSFIFLSVPVRESVDQSVVASRAAETMCASCDKCNAANVDFTSTVAIKATPAFLCIHFLRFQFDAVKMLRTKVQAATKISAFLPASAITGDSADHRTYRLRAVVNHVGASPDNGHYVAHIAAHDDGRWYLFDDDVVQPSEFFQPVADGGEVSSKEAYLAFYELLVTEGEGTAHRTPSVRAQLAAAIAVSEDEQLHMAADLETLKQEKRHEFARWEAVCGSVFPTSNAQLVVQRDAELLDRHFISARWLGTLADGSVVPAEDMQRRVTNRDILCHHNLVAPSAKLRVVTSSAWTAIHEEYGCDKPLPILDSMCSECCRDYVTRRQASQETFRDWEAVRKGLDADLPLWKYGDPQSAAATEEPVFVSASALDAVLDHRDPPEEAETTLIDLTGDLVCPHGAVAPHIARRVVSQASLSSLLEYGYRCSKPLPCKLNDVCGECNRAHATATAAAHATKLLKFRCQKALTSLRHHDKNKAIFNRDLVKYTRNHRRMWHEKRDKELAEAAAKKAAEEKAAAEAAAISAKQHANSIAITFKTRGGSKAPSSSSGNTAASVHVDPVASSSATAAKVTSTPPSVEVVESSQESASAAPEEAVLPPPRVATHFVLPVHWVARFNDWMDDSTHATVAAPPKPVCDEFVCEHGLCSIGVVDLHPSKRRDGPIGIVVKEGAELESLVENFAADAARLVKLIEHDEERILDPPECQLCTHLRREREEFASRYFDRGTIMIEGKVRKTKKQRVSVNTVLTPVAHNMTVEGTIALLCQVLAHEYELFISADYIRLLHEKVPLEGLHTMLSAHGIRDGATLTMEVDEDQWLHAEEVQGETWQQVPPEALAAHAPLPTFAGSALAGAGVASSATKTHVKECPLCTFHNAPNRTVCEMCESLLPI